MKQKISYNKETDNRGMVVVQAQSLREKDRHIHKERQTQRQTQKEMENFLTWDLDISELRATKKSRALF